MGSKATSEQKLIQVLKKSAQKKESVPLSAFLAKGHITAPLQVLQNWCSEMFLNFGDILEITTEKDEIGFYYVIRHRKESYSGLVKDETTITFRFLADGKPKICVGLFDPSKEESEEDKHEFSKGEVTALTNFTKEILGTILDEIPQLVSGDLDYDNE